MRKVTRDEIIDYQTYGDEREEFRARVLAAKDERRLAVGEHITLLFENRLTIRYQIQEMMRIERMAREKDILHEIETYNEVIGDDGELGCTLLVEIDDPAERDVKLREWLELSDHLYLRLEDGTRVPAIFDKRQVGDDRLSAVQYVKFDTKGAAPVAAGVDLPTLNVEVEIPANVRTALAADLAE